MTTTKFRFRFSRGMKYDFLCVRCSFCGCAEVDKDLCRKTELVKNVTDNPFHHHDLKDMTIFFVAHF